MRHFATESGKSKGQFYTPSEVSRIMAKVIGISPGKHQSRHHRLRPHLRLRLAAAEGRRRGGQAHHARRAGEGRDHRRPRPHEHDPARLPDGQHQSGQHAVRSQVQGRRAAPHLRLRRRQSALLATRRWSTGLDARAGPLPALHLGRAAEEAGRLRLPPAHHPLHEEHGQRRLHSPARRPLPGQCRGRHPPAARPLRLPQGHHRPARRISFTAPASPPASSCSTRKTPPPARASS